MVLDDHSGSGVHRDLVRTRLDVKHDTRARERHRAHRTDPDVRPGLASGTDTSIDHGDELSVENGDRATRGHILGPADDDRQGVQEDAHGVAVPIHNTGRPACVLVLGDDHCAPPVRDGDAARVRTAAVGREHFGVLLVQNVGVRWRPRRHRGDGGGERDDEGEEEEERVEH